jgi:hypothetical protein
MVALPDEVATQWQAYLARNGITAMGELFLRVLMHAEQHLDYDALTLLLQGAAQRIAYQGPDKPPLDLSILAPSVVIYRYLRKLVLMLTDEAGLPGVPGSAAFAKTRRYAWRSLVPSEGRCRATMAAPPSTTARIFGVDRQLRVVEGGKQAAAEPNDKGILRWRR